MVTSEDNTRLYGDSSTIALVRHIAHGTSTGSLTMPVPASPHMIEDDGERLHPRGFTQDTGRTEKDLFWDLCPSRRTADKFMHCYWEFVHPVFPILHKTSFEAMYETFWLPHDDNEQSNDSTETEDVFFRCKLNLTFALGCQFSDVVPPSQKGLVAEDFYQRSRRLFIYDILDSTSISCVQMLLLTGVYLQSTRYADRCWNAIGLAIRAAQSLGLHLDTSSHGQTSQLDNEMQRRVWHCCVVLDRYVLKVPGWCAL